MTRQLINDPADAVTQALEGLALCHPDLLDYRPDQGHVRRRRPARDKVGVVAGGGSGHEPLHVGFVGAGMLDVAVPGSVFTSPTALQLHTGTLAADTGRGVVQIVKNYTGDVLNFTIAGELADDDAVPTRQVLVDDDVATGGAGSGPGRRGTAAVLVVEKVVGACAEAGADLDAVAAVGRRAAAGSRTMGLVLRAGTFPGRHTPAFELPEDQVELGVGIHGERGRTRVGFAGADALVEQLVAPVLAELAPARGTAVIAVVNGFGGSYPLELSIAARAVHRLVTDRGITVARLLAGSYVTSLDAHGLSVTLTVADDELLALWDAPVRTPALSW